MNKLPKELDDELFLKLKSAIELQRMSTKERLAYELSIAAERDFSALPPDVRFRTKIVRICTNTESLTTAKH